MLRIFKYFISIIPVLLGIIATLVVAMSSKYIPEGNDVELDHKNISLISAETKQELNRINTDVKTLYDIIKKSQTIPENAKLYTTLQLLQKNIEDIQRGHPESSRKD